ncbi:hypothetical protein SI65_08127 [Aspergillus cristatus]|uniref:NWD NACHT-NTPase N-terminal domain-containing protein n=1 Tax=Aspergillus cristatus TaxID=573508 RepID=A0A1E3B6N1_ASPCR|nr:hypothetical protein SI65_08127 [Aspergillus cristatus]
MLHLPSVDQLSCRSRVSQLNIVCKKDQNKASTASRTSVHSSDSEDDTVNTGNANTGNKTGDEKEVKTTHSTDAVNATNSPRRNLWQEAYEKLDPQRQEAYTFDDPVSASAVIDEITDRASKEVLLILLDKTGHGMVLLFFSSLGFIVGGKETQASAAWSVVSLGLQLAQNDFSHQRAFLEAVEYLSGLLAKYAIFDKEYRNPELPTITLLEDALVMVYKSILRYTDQVKKVQMENGFERAVSSITALTGNLFSELQTSIRDQDTEVVRLSGFAADLGLARLGENLLTQLQESHKTIVNINRRALAGCGKSVLCSTIIEHIKGHIGDDPT